MKRLLISCLLITSGLLATTKLASADNLDFTVGATLGKCSTSVYLQMCDQSKPVWHIYGKASYAVSSSFTLVGSVDHFSSFDGKADLSGDEAHQSGTFDYAGIGVEWRF